MEHRRRGSICLPGQFARGQICRIQRPQGLPGLLLPPASLEKYPMGPSGARCPQIQDCQKLPSGPFWGGFRPTYRATTAPSIPFEESPLPGQNRVPSTSPEQPNHFSEPFPFSLRGCPPGRGVFCHSETLSRSHFFRPRGADRRRSL